MTGLEEIRESSKIYHNNLILEYKKSLLMIIRNLLAEGRSSDVVLCDVMDMLNAERE